MKITITPVKTSMESDFLTYSFYINKRSISIYEESDKNCFDLFYIYFSPNYIYAKAIRILNRNFYWED